MKRCNDNKEIRTVDTSISSSKWCDHFKSLLNKNDINTDYLPPDELSSITHDANNDALNKDISEDEIFLAISQLNAGKSPGPDGICIDILKYISPMIIPYLHQLFNEILTTGIVPESWGESIIVPIHKKCSRTEPNNYRGISLINATCKIFTYILNNRLYSWCEENKLLDESQAGFRQNYSTVDNIFTLMSVTQKYISKRGGRFYCIFIDFSKAFDSIQHAILWDALKRKNINGRFLNVLQSIYRNLKSCIKVDGGLSDFFECNIGTRQGCICSSVIFSLFINDLIIYLKNAFPTGIFITEDICDLFALMYADDVSSMSETAIQLQRQINKISDFCDAVKMEINLDKTKIIVFRNGGILRHYEKWFYRNNIIETVSFYKYLGMYMTPKLSWSKTHEFAAKQASKAIACIFRYQKSFGRFRPFEIFKLFDSMVKPILCYGAEIWGYQFTEQVEIVHLNFCKQYCMLPQQTANVFVYGECGRLPLCTSYMTRCVKYWIKLLQMGSDRFPSQSYKMLKRIDDSGRNTWAGNIKHMLFSLGFGYVWIAQDVGDPLMFLSSFKRRLIDCNIQKWNEGLNNTSKAETYKSFKTLLEPEKYLSLNLPFVMKSMLARFRTSTHDLMIEKGRHIGLDRYLRHCPLCKRRNILIVENEFHFLIECAEYEELRQEIFGHSFFRRRNIHVFNWVMSNNDPRIIAKLSKFIYRAFDLRKTVLSST